MAWVLYHAGRYDEARKAYQDLIEQFDAEAEADDDRDALHKSRVALSNLDVEAGKLRRGEEWLQQVLDEFPDDVEALDDLGYLGPIPTSTSPGRWRWSRRRSTPSPTTAPTATAWGGR